MLWVGGLVEGRGKFKLVSGVRGKGGGGESVLDVVGSCVHGESELV